jgi:hypothetical protein
VRANDAWSLATGATPPGKELTVVDDGADEQQAALPLGTELSNVVEYTRYVAGTGNDGWHGTPVLGAAIARSNGVGVVGVAPGATARVAKIDDRSSGYGWDYYAAQAIDAHAANSAVITMSRSTKQTSSSPPASFTAMYDAIKRAYYNYGVVIVASTGNQGHSDYYAYPAAYPEVVGVGGSGYSDEYQLNNYAPGNVEVSAPAVDVGTVCKGGQAGLATGTSFATPMVAAAFMILREQFPSESPGQLRSRIKSTAVPMVDTQKSGAGRMDVLAALNYVPPPGVSISNTPCVRQSTYAQFNAVVSGGVAPYTYSWYQSSNGGTGTGSSYSVYVSSATYPVGSQIGVQLTVTDAAGRAVSTYGSTYVQSYYATGCN